LLEAKRHFKIIEPVYQATAAVATEEHKETVRRVPPSAGVAPGDPEDSELATVTIRIFDVLAALGETQP
jgi:hypothetical protein